MTETAAFQDALDRYIQVCEQALASDQVSAPMRAIFQAALKNMEGKSLSLALYDDRPKALCNIDIADKQVKVSNSRGIANNDRPEDHHTNPRVVRLSLTDIQDVIKKPDRYLKNPALLDWSWLNNLSAKSED